MTGRMSVTATTPGTNPNWIVFALTNPTDKPVERWLTAERYNIIGSGAVWPDLDARRIEAVTPSIGFVPERIKSDRADIFRITLEPGQTITYVAELASDRFARLYLWKPLDYELKIARPAALQRHHAGPHRPARHLPDGDLRRQPQGRSSRARRSSPGACWPTCASTSASSTSCSSCAPEDNAVYRAAARIRASRRVSSSSSHVFLRIAFWHGLIRMLITVWIIAQLTLVAVAVIDPRLAVDVRAHVVPRHRRRRRRLHAVPRAARPGPRAVADPDVDPVPRLDLRRRR